MSDTFQGAALGNNPPAKTVRAMLVVPVAPQRILAWLVRTSPTRKDLILVVACAVSWGADFLSRRALLAGSETYRRGPSRPRCLMANVDSYILLHYSLQLHACLLRYISL